MRILINNDDGYFAPGIAALVRAMAKRHEVVVCAPKLNQSAVSHGLTLRTPLHVERVDIEGADGVEAYSVDGTPADCTRLALVHLKLAPDAVVSGINQAGNIGTDVLYSGTVSAAAEAAMLGYRAIAVSRDTLSTELFDDAAEHFCESFELFLSCTTEERRLLNVNYPFLPRAQYRGIRAAYLAEQVYAEVYEQITDEDGRVGFRTPWQKLTPCPEDATTDEKLIRDGFVTVTPLKYDITDYEQLARIAAHIEKSY